MTLLLWWTAQASAGETLAYANLAGGLGFTMHNIGDFALGLEHVAGHHGLLAEGTLVHVHGNPTHATTYGAQLGYRYHAATEGHAPFVGVVAGWETGSAKYDHAEHGGPFWRYGLRHVSLVPHLGYRWRLGQHAALTVRFGGGYGTWTVTPPDGAPDSATALLRDRLQFTPVKLDSELSFGVRF